MLGQSGCAGVDAGDGFDCYGNVVRPDDPRTRRLTGAEIADVWRRLRMTTPQFYSFEEQAHLKAGTFGQDGLTLWRTQAPTTPGLPPVSVVASMTWPLILLALVILNGLRAHRA